MVESSILEKSKTLVVWGKNIEFGEKFNVWQIINVVPDKIKTVKKHSLIVTYRFKTRIHHSFISSNCFILVRVTVDPEPILGTLCVSRQYTMAVMPVRCRAPWTHIDTKGQFHIANLLYLLKSVRRLAQTMGRACETPHGQ